MQEPGHVGADVVMGSFIKNPGGTLATGQSFQVFSCVTSALMRPASNLPGRCAGGGYIAGRKDIISQVQHHLVEASMGETRASTEQLMHGVQAHLPTTMCSRQQLFLHLHTSITLQCLHACSGLWMAPSRVGEALKGGRLLVQYARRARLNASPEDPVLVRPSYITAIQLGSAQAMIKFCETVQQSSPVGSYVRPVPGETTLF
jgi:cystathionine beta-lyase family protein involved in aluminum resistance